MYVSLQETARKRKGWTLEAVSLGSDVMRCFKDDVKGPPLEGVYVHGLVMDNASWDTRASRIIDAKQQVQWLHNIQLLYVAYYVYDVLSHSPHKLLYYATDRLSMAALQSYPSLRPSVQLSVRPVQASNSKTKKHQNWHKR